MRWSAAAKNLMLERLDEGQAGGATHASAHSAYSTTGTNELSGGSPAYARKALTWSAASGGAKALTSGVTFDIPAGSTVAWIGLWDAITAGNFLGMTPNGGGTPEAFTTPDIATDFLEAPGHGFTDGQTVVVWAVPGVALPTGLSEGTVYYVRDATTDDLKLSLTSGGAAINLTAVGSGFLQRIMVEAFVAQGTHNVSAATMAID